MRLQKWIPIILLLSLIFTFTFATVVNAEEKQEPSEDYKKIEDKFDCDSFDPVCHVKLWMISITMDIFDSVALFVKLAVIATNTIIYKPKVIEYLGYFKETSQVLISAFFLFHLVKVLSYYWIEQDTQRFKTMINKLLITTVMIAGYQWAFSKLVLVMIESVVKFEPDLGEFEAMFLTLLTPYASLVTLLFLLMGLLVLIVSFQVLIRSAELAFMYMVGPFAIATNLNEEFNLFTPWWRTLLSIMITQFVQVFLVMFTIDLVSNSEATISGIHNYYLAIAMMILVIKSPAFIKEFMYSTGAGQTVVGMTTKTAGAVSKQLIRFAMKK
ncbi:conjugal transfer protein TrbL family protein [Hazenella coriacea]|uniref:TrbL/VirB6 plasmid conjugal transfer protein n=1 Tax=Hazenella coriacea TaxID=1179467 RepID=A0A4R3L4Y9_9BACL|nr:conjugal transfer protein TrbL family protein [Hazenella coriacea]TCS94851.1 hypothetical protein EDD58_103274 [Hazenella coriacea]